MDIDFLTTIQNDLFMARSRVRKKSVLKGPIRLKA
ncbi:hypothetical protein CCACVL1_03391 [Corchorus capsularis]|uniref:Uncharacterized protein n=1 Tax=Corchorus capsularis TaxID=210143 RepID=A0A1R3JZZ1_COCAP|nr:hypothetical protein CCACVL1_03391 [Corchorus capsularis]